MKLIIFLNFFLEVIANFLLVIKNCKVFYIKLILKETSSSVFSNEIFPPNIFCILFAEPIYQLGKARHVVVMKKIFA